jgi:hypothetical protein
MPTVGLAPPSVSPTGHPFVSLTGHQSCRGRHAECWSDDQAMEMAMKEEGSHFGIQAWDGEGPVCLVGNPRGNPAMLD